MNSPSTIETLETFASHRQLLFSIAYRMLDNLSEAEDMVQEVWLRWHNQDVAGIRSPKAWLQSAMRRLCIDQLRSARHQREVYCGDSLPEATSTTTAKPDISAERETSLTRAFTLILTTLKPVERAVFLLREVFDYDYADTAALVGKGEANCRQIARRAKAQLLAHATPPPPPNPRSRQWLEQFVSAAATGEVRDLLDLMKEDAPPSRDGGRQTKGTCCRSHPSDLLARGLRTFTPAAHARCASCSARSKSAGCDTPACAPGTATPLDPSTHAHRQPT